MYTSWKIKQAHAPASHQQKSLSDKAEAFALLLRQQGLCAPEAAKILHVSPRTIHNWATGHHAVPYSAFKLLRVMRYLEIPFEGWEGWFFCMGSLYSPEGHRFSGKDSSWWSLLVRQARMFSVLYQENTELRRQLAATAAPAPEPASLGEVLVTPHFSLTHETTAHTAADQLAATAAPCLPVKVPVTPSLSPFSRKKTHKTQPQSLRKTSRKTPDIRSSRASSTAGGVL